MTKKRVDDDSEKNNHKNFTDDDLNVENNKINRQCNHCKIKRGRNQCSHSKSYFCENCELKVNGESIFEFFDNFKSDIYTCRIVHPIK